MLTAEFDLSEFERDAKAFEAKLAAGTRHAVGTATQDAIAHVRASHRYKDKTGTLTEGLHATNPVTLPGGGAEAELRSDAKYSSYVEEDTLAHDIRPKVAKSFKGPTRKSQGRKRGEKVAAYLVFQFPDGTWRRCKVVKHPGTHGKGFMGDAALKAESLLMSRIDAAATEAAKVFD